MVPGRTALGRARDPRRGPHHAARRPGRAGPASGAALRRRRRVRQYPPQVLEAHGTQTGLLGTVKRVEVGGVEEEVERTTPEAIDLQHTFRRMLEGGDEACAMEIVHRMPWR